MSRTSRTSRISGAISYLKIYEENEPAGWSKEAERALISAKKLVDEEFVHLQTRRVCKQCGKEFHKSARNQMYCSPACSQEAIRAARRIWWAKNGKDWRTTRDWRTRTKKAVETAVETATALKRSRALKLRALKLKEADE